MLYFLISSLYFPLSLSPAFPIYTSSLLKTFSFSFLLQFNSANRSPLLRLRFKFEELLHFCIEGRGEGVAKHKNGALYYIWRQQPLGMTPVIIQPQCVDREGKTPLMAACLNPALHHVVKLLIELGANVNAYRHANALLVNDDCQTAPDIARAKGFTNIVRAIENHICLYAGWLRKPMMPGFLELLARQFLSRKVWAVVLPSGSRNLRKPFKLELAIYTSILDAQPHSKIALWKADMEEPAFNLHNPAVVLCGILTITFIENYDTRSTQVAKFQIVLKLPVLPNYAAVFRSPLILLVDCQG